MTSFKVLYSMVEHGVSHVNFVTFNTTERFDPWMDFPLTSASPELDNYKLRRL